MARLKWRLMLACYFVKVNYDLPRAVSENVIPVKLEKGPELISIHSHINKNIQ